MSREYRPNLPRAITLPEAELLPSARVRALLGGVTRQAVANWTRKAQMPHAFVPNGQVARSGYFTSQLHEWLEARGVTVTRGTP